MNLIAFSAAFILIAVIAGISVVAIHLFRDTWVSYAAFFTAFICFFLILPISVAIGYEFGG